RINALRKNHALEHATIALLLPRLGGKVHLIGHAGLTGFYIYGDIPTNILEKSAHEALRRLHEGEKDLAVSSMCGTNLVVTGLATGIASLIAGRGHSGSGKFSRVIKASIVAALIAQPLGRLAQKHVTTVSDLDDVSIVRVVRTGKGKRTRHKVEVLRS
ncbi:MAG: DUF6391 domain-containing protein, partial [Chloroflexota bacterium]|nr:DUF6391 domain-containing protein [Chloroflexota bacterium]